MTELINYANAFYRIPQNERQVINASIRKDITTKVGVAQCRARIGAENWHDRQALAALWTEVWDE
ncbi:MAG: hypothetical protein V3S69_07945 [Dehalococcoidales bacterium]